ncbi:MAG: hypothetical protein JOY72_12110, partial [Actinobacteria bacterium]|nr:hypothetical protein [Actinomycetota bacterium]MBV8599751.1 hypothetical protein [Actinomycetota bacterium]
MAGLLLVAAALVSAALISLALRLPSGVSTLLAAYLAFVTNVVLTVLVLSPTQWATRGGIAVVEAVVLAFATWLWHRRGRPRPRVAGPALRAVVTFPATALMLAA